MIITGYKGRGNIVTLLLTYNGVPFDPVAAGVTSARLEAGCSYIDVTFDGDEFSFVPGDLDLKTGCEYAAKLILFSPQYPKGLVVAGPGEQPITVVLYS